MNKNIFNPENFKEPFEAYYLKNCSLDRQFVLIKYNDILHVKYKNIRKCTLLFGEGAHDKGDIMMLCSESDWSLVKQHINKRSSVRDLKMKYEVGLYKKLDTAKHIDPYIFQKEPLRKPTLVKVCLRNGLLVKCKLLKQDDFQIIARVKDYETEQRALVLIYKHGIYDVTAV